MKIKAKKSQHTNTIVGSQGFSMSRALTQKQTRVLAFIQRMIGSEGRPPTQAEIAEDLGIANRVAARQHLLALVEKGYIELEEGSSRGLRIVRETLAALSPNRLPVIGRIAAGTPLLSDGNVEEFVTIEPTLFRPKAHFLRRIEGWSMRNAHIFDGDLVGIHQTSEASNRQIVAVQIEHPRTGEFEVTLKRYIKNGQNVVLFSENDDQEQYPPIRINPERQAFAIEGVFAGLVRRAD